MVRIKDIAEHCHRSTATVSKALHDSPELSPQTIEKIKRCAKKWDTFQMPMPKL